MAVALPTLQPRMLRSRTALAGPVWAACLVAGSWIGEGRAAAQTPPMPSPGILLSSPPERVAGAAPPEVGLVQVEVVVTDPAHHPVTGLPEKAFYLEEDGQRQRLVSFQAVDLDESPAPQSTPSRSSRVSTNAADANATSPRTFVVAFDDLHLGPEGATRAREIADRFITQHTLPGDLVVLVAPGEDLLRSDPMPDGRLPLAEVTRSLRGQRDPAATATDDDSTRRRRRRTLSALAAALEILPGAGNRKSVLLLSEGFLYEPGDPLAYQVIAASQRANAVIHFLDVRGLTARRGTATGAEILATITGGSVLQNGSDLAPALDRLSQEASHHYVLGYQPRGERRGGRFRKIRVGVSRPDLLVQARKGYYEAPDDPADSQGEDATLDGRLQDALRSSSLIRQIPLRLTALALAPAEDGAVEVTFVSEVNARGLQLARLPDGSPVARLDAVLEIRHQQPRASQVANLQHLAVKVPRSAPAEEVWLPLQRSFTLPPGRSHVKLAVRDRSSGAIGTVVHDLEVPSADDFRFSSPILSDTPEGEGVKPPRIVARRSFATGSVLYCYFEVYPRPGIPPRDPDEAGASYEIVDARGRVRQRAALPLPVRGEGGGLSRLVEIPLTRMAPGEYELVLDLAGEATGGADELREPFSVTRPQRFNDDLYRDALDAYLEGDFESAVATLLQWPAKEILAAARRLPQTGDAQRETALMLHTDLAMVLRRHGRTQGARTHLAIGRALLEGSPPDLHREWLMALAYSHQASLRPAEALVLYDECAQAFPDAAEARLGAGTLHERTAFLPEGFGGGTLDEPPQMAAEAAEAAYREALSIQPSLTEARLRLARVFQKTDRVDQALAQLSLVVESSQDASLTALAHLFWGEIDAAAGDVDGAIEHYRAAVDADSALQVAALALAEALHRRDGRQASVDALLPALEPGRTSPWITYRQGPQELATSSIRELRQRLRAAAGDPK